MFLTNREQEKLMLYTASCLAHERKSRVHITEYLNSVSRNT